MKITFLGSINKPSQECITDTTNIAPASVFELLKLLGFPPEQHRFISIIVQGKRIPHHQRLNEEDDIIITVPVGGG